MPRAPTPSAWQRTCAAPACASTSTPKRINLGSSSNTPAHAPCRSWRFTATTSVGAARWRSRTCAPAIRRRWHGPTRLLTSHRNSMAEPLGQLTRTHTCGALRPTDVGADVVLLGWVHRIRDLGGVTFIDIRDRAGVSQVVVRENDALMAVAKRLRAEYV